MIGRDLELDVGFISKLIRNTCKVLNQLLLVFEEGKVVGLFNRLVSGRRLELKLMLNIEITSDRDFVEGNSNSQKKNL